MKTLITVVVAATLLSACFVTAQTSSSQPPQITVTGSAEVKVVPDEIQFSMSVETRNEKLDEAKRQNDERVAKVLQFLKSQGIGEKDVQTDFMSIEPSYDSKVSRDQAILYIVRKSIGARLTQISKFDAITTGLLQNGVNHLNSIELRTSKLREHRDEARAMAIQAARDKADALATALAVKRGKVYNITATEGGGGWAPRGMNQNVAVGSAGGSTETGETLSVGEISITATVTVSFLIE